MLEVADIALVIAATGVISLLKGRRREIQGKQNFTEASISITA